MSEELPQTPGNQPSDTSDAPARAKRKRNIFSRKSLDIFVERFLKYVLRIVNIKLPQKEELNRIIFYSDTPAGKKFDIYLLYAIGISVFIPILDSMTRINDVLHIPLIILEYVLTISFSIEYILRIYCSKHPVKYIISFFGIVDALSIFPFYLAILFPGLQSLATIRILRVLRIFRILNMRQFMSEAYAMLEVLKRSFRKILIFMMFVFMVAIILGSFMYSVEGSANPNISSIPKGIYWAIVTITTVGYGDITPTTDIGQVIAGIVMILGYSIIAVPTGIIGGEIVNAAQQKNESRSNRRRKKCARCGATTNDPTSSYCKFCGTRLHHVYDSEDDPKSNPDNRPPKETDIQK